MQSQKTQPPARYDSPRATETAPSQVLLDESWKTERVINYFRAALWTCIGAITVIAELELTPDGSIGAETALAWGLVCLVIGIAWRRRRFMRWLPWVLTSTDITVVGVCMYTGYLFAQKHAPAVVTHQVYGSGLVMLVVVSSNMLRFSPWISLWSTLYGALVYFVLLHRTLGMDPLSFVEIVLVGMLGAMLLYSARKLSVIVRRELAREEQLRQAQKMEAVGQITGGVAHDFNNLLTVILGNAELLKEGQRAGTAAYDLSQTIIQAAQRGALLTRRLLAYARRQTLQVNELDLNQLVGGMASLLTGTLGEHIEIVITRDSGLWKTLADASEVENALLNLALNARDAMPGGGRLTLATQNVHLGEAEAARHPDAKPGDYVKLSVADTGTGMPPEVIRRAFDPFFTTKDVGKGSGLGLSMVHGFVHQSGGHVLIESEVGRGTTVSLFLPRFVGTLKRGRIQREEPEQAPTGTETVLVVEDDQLVRGHIVQLLVSLGYTVLAADDGRMALAKLDRAGHVDLLFTDMVMPGGMNGVELAEEARRQRPDVKVLLTSGYSDTLANGKGRGADYQLLMKPYRKTELARKVREVLDAPAPAR